MKKRIVLLEILGFLFSFLPPAVAAITEFPIKKVTAASPAELLGLSSAALLMVGILALLSLWHGFAGRLSLPHSGVLPATLLFVTACVLENYIHSFRVVMFYAMLGAIAGLVFRKIAERLRGKKHAN